MEDQSKPSQSPPKDRAKFSQLMREHHMDLIVFARAIVREHQAAQDIVQDSLITAWKKFDQFDPEQNFGAWVRGIIRNKSKDWFRKLNREPLGDVELVDLEIEVGEWETRRASGTGMFESIELCMGKLPEKLHAAVHQHYFCGLTSPEAAEVLEVSAATLRKRIERARGLLADCLNRTEPEIATSAALNHV